MRSSNGWRSFTRKGGTAKGSDHPGLNVNMYGEDERSNWQFRRASDGCFDSVLVGGKYNIRMRR